MRTLRHVTATEITEAREIAKRIAKKHGIKLSVRKGTGSIRGTVTINDARNEWTEDPAPRIELAEALIAAGFESQFGASPTGMTLTNHAIGLAKRAGHSHIRLGLLKRI